MILEIDLYNFFIKGIMEGRWDTLFALCDENKSSADSKDKINIEHTSERWWQHCLEVDRYLKHSLMLEDSFLEIDKKLKSADLTEEQTRLMIREEKCKRIKQEFYTDAYNLI